MNRYLMMLFAILLCFSPVYSQLPPIIDRELFFGDPEISGAQISPDGTFISFLKPFQGVRNIWVKERSEPFENARPITADTARPISSYFWSRDGKFILYVQDKGGDENYRIYAVDPKGKETPVPTARDLTPLEKVRAEIIDVPKSSPNQIIIGLNDRRADLHDVYRLDLSTGEKTLLRKNDQNIVGWTTDLNGDLRLGMRLTADGGSEILRVDPDTLISLYTVNSEETCSPSRFTPDGKKFYLETNKNRDRVELELFDLATGKSVLVDTDPQKEVDLGQAFFSDVTNELVATFYVGDRQRVYPKQKEFAATWAAMKKALPAGEIGLVSTTADENVLVVSVSSDVDPGSRYLFDRTSGKAELLYRSRPNLPSSQLASMKPVRYSARDGLVIPAYLVLPKGVPAKNLPTVMLIHGGPWARDMWGYNPEAQFYANRGYAVLMPNFRGSTGYGKKFLNAGNKQWGRGFMQHDITDGVKYLVAKKIADPKRMGIYGGSYGGYATLAGVAFTPDLYAAGVSYVGPSNIITLLKSIPPYWGPVKKIFAIRVGDIENPKDRKLLEDESPLNFAKDIKASLLVIQGANDPRVNKGESDRIVIALRDLGRPVEYLVAPDEGHGFAGKLNRLAAYTAMERFFAKHLGGRFQETMTPEIQAQLTKLTVDVSTLKVADNSVQAPKSVFTADPGLVKQDTMTYIAKMSVMGRDLSFTVRRAIAPFDIAGKNGWRVTESMESAMGTGTDTLVIDAATLLPLTRSGKQGPATVGLTFSRDSINGILTNGGQSMPVNVKLTQATFPDGAGLEIPVTTLPLKEGYSTSVAVFELMQGVKIMSLVVEGIDHVTIGTREYDAYRVSLTNPDDPSSGQKLWIAKDTRKLVKTEMKLPATMGGGTMVSELQ